MALIVCPECGHEISDKAPACPHCGYPLSAQETQSVSEGVSPAVNPDKKKPASKKKVIVIAAVVVALLICAVLGIFVGKQIHMRRLWNEKYKLMEEAETQHTAEFIEFAEERGKLFCEDLDKYIPDGEPPRSTYSVDENGIYITSAFGYTWQGMEELAETEPTHYAGFRRVFGESGGIADDERANYVKAGFLDKTFRCVFTSLDGSDLFIYENGLLTFEAFPEADASGGTDEQEIAATLRKRIVENKAYGYLQLSSFSRSGLVDQLLNDGLSREEAVYAVDHVGADWEAQAEKSAWCYLSLSSFSRSGLYDQLIYEGFTPEEASYGVSAVGY